MNQWRGPILICFLMLASCSGANTDTTQGVTSAQAICDQSCQVNEVGFAVDNTMWLLWNENFAGVASGNQDKTVTCPLSGTAHITGTTGVASNQINTVHLVFDLQNCGNSDTYYTMNFTGPMTWDGSFGGAGGNALTFKSAALEISGTVRRYDRPTVTETCAVSLTDTYNSSASTQSGWLDGAICGRTVIQ